MIRRDFSAFTIAFQRGAALIPAMDQPLKSEHITAHGPYPGNGTVYALFF